MQVEANTIAGNEAFSKKKPIYGTSSFTLTAELAQSSVWDITDIEARQLRLAGLAVKAWPITVK